VVRSGPLVELVHLICFGRPVPAVLGRSYPNRSRRPHRAPVPAAPRRLGRPVEFQVGQAKVERAGTMAIRIAGAAHTCLAQCEDP
jgi:hypothetical protein